MKRDSFTSQHPNIRISRPSILLLGVLNHGPADVFLRGHTVYFSSSGGRGYYINTYITNLKCARFKRWEQFFASKRGKIKTKKKQPTKQAVDSSLPTPRLNSCKIQQWLLMCRCHQDRSLPARCSHRYRGSTHTSWFLLSFTLVFTLLYSKP